MSREEAIKIIESVYERQVKDSFKLEIKDPVFIDFDVAFNMAIEALNQQKEGHWIMPVQDDGMSDPIYYQVRCSECGFDLDPQTWHMELHQYGADKYCPNCGAKMKVGE